MKQFYLLAIVLFFLTVFLRIWQIEEKFNFNAEYNYKLWPIKEIIYDKKIRLIGIEAVSYLHHLHYPPLALYIFAPILYLSNANPLSIEIALIFLSGVTVVLIFYLGYKLFGTNVGLFAGLIYGISFFVQRADRFIWVVGPLIFYTVVYLIVIDKIFKQKKINFISFFLLGALVGLALNFHFQAAVFFFVSIVLFFTYYSFNKALKLLTAFVLGALLLVSPILVFELRHNFYNLQGIIYLTKDSGGIAQASLLSQVYKSVSTVSAMPLKIISNNIDGQSLSPVFISAVFVAQLAAVAWFLKFSKKLNRKLEVFLLASFLLWLFGLLSFPFVQNRYYSTEYYLYFLIPVYILAFGYILEKITHYYVPGSVILGAIIGIFTYYNLNLASEFTVNPNWEIQNMAVDYIYKNRQSEKLRIKFTSFPSEEYAFLFYYKSKAYNFPYESIEFIEPWHEDKNYNFIFSSDKEVYPNSRRFGRILIAKTN